MARKVLGDSTIAWITLILLALKTHSARANRTCISPERHPSKFGAVEHRWLSAPLLGARIMVFAVAAAVQAVWLRCRGADDLTLPSGSPVSPTHKTTAYAVHCYL